MFFRKYIFLSHALIQLQNGRTCWFLILYSPINRQFLFEMLLCTDLYLSTFLFYEKNVFPNAVLNLID